MLHSSSALLLVYYVYALAATVVRCVTAVLQPPKHPLCLRSCGPFASCNAYISVMQLCAAEVSATAVHGCQRRPLSLLQPPRHVCLLLPFRWQAPTMCAVALRPCAGVPFRLPVQPELLTPLDAGGGALPPPRCATRLWGGRTLPASTLPHPCLYSPVLTE